MEGHRAERVSETMREELAEIIGYEMSDPRIASVYVTEVNVGADMRHAHVRIGLPGGPEEQNQALEALEHARHFLRRTLSQRIQLYRIPELHFELDASVAPSRVDQLLKRIRKGRGRGGSEDKQAE
jgi:ribosome-binding factor A